MSEVLRINFVNNSDNFRDYRNPSLTSETLALIGPSKKGPAFVPTLVNSFARSQPGGILNTFENIFGEEYAPLVYDCVTPVIANIWFSGGGSQLSYTRVLGVGDESGKDIDTGIVNGSGFIVGQKNSKNSITPGKIDDNNNAQRSNLDVAAGDKLKLGRTFFFCNKYNNSKVTNKIFSSYESNMYGNLSENENFYLVDKIFLTQQGIYLTLNNKQHENSQINGNDITNLSLTFKNVEEESSLKNITVKSSTSYGTNENSLFGGFIHPTKSIEASVERICINGLNNQDYARVTNILRFDNDINLKHINFYNDPLGTTNKFINKSFKRLNDRGYIEYCNFLFKNNYLYKPDTAIICDDNNCDINSEVVYDVSSQILLPSVLDHNESSVDNNIPSYEDFQSTYRKAKTPWVVSQHIYGWPEDENTSRVDIDKRCIDLFRFHACDDGEIGNRFRIRIKPKKLGKKSGKPKNIDLETNKMLNEDIWSTFDITIKEYNHKLNSFSTVMEVSNVDLNPDSENYICRMFGTKNTYYDFDNDKIVDVGFYDKTNQYLFVEVHPDVEDKLNSCTLIPSGFYSYPHININQDSLLSEELLSVIQDNPGSTPIENAIKNSATGEFYKVFQKPVDYIRNLKYEEASGDIENIDSKEYYWGVQFNNSTDSFDNLETNVRIGEEGEKTIPEEMFLYQKYLEDSTNFRSGNKFLSPYYDYTKWFQNSRKDVNVWIEEKNYLNSFFHLEKILYMRSANSLNDKYRFSSYRRDGKSISNIKIENGNDADRNEIIDLFEYVNINSLFEKEGDDLRSDHAKFLKFDFFTYGGFDGLDCFNYDKKQANNDAVIRELEDENNNGFKSGPTYSMYSRAINITTKYENTDCDILSVPNITHPKILREIFEVTKEKDRFISLIDIPKIDSSSQFITGSLFKESYKANENSDLSSEYEGNIIGNQILSIFPTDKKDLDGNTIYTDIKKLSEQGSVSTFNFFNKFNLEGRNIFAAYNDVITSYEIPVFLGGLIGRVNQVFMLEGNTSKFLLPPTALAVNCFAKTYNSPQINIDRKLDYISTNSEFDFLKVINLNLWNESNEKSNLLRLTESCGINAIGRTSSYFSNVLSFNSANSLKDDRRSIFRSIHNTRILNRIRKILKFRIYGAFGQDILLFNNNFLRDNIYRKLERVVNETLDNFVDRGELESFQVDLGKKGILNENSSNSINCKILLSFYGKNDNGNLTNLKIDNIISSVDQLIESFNENIVIVRT